jgi:hypothetical protein
MRLQIFSDVHCEQFHDPATIWSMITPKADIAVVAGDIDSRKFELSINEISTKFKHVICVLGNHSFYRKDIDWRPDQRLLSKNVHLLDRGVWQYYNTVFIGVTLWTDFKNQDFFVMHAAKDCINDFRVITANNGGTRFTPQMAYDKHLADRAYLKMMVEKLRAEDKKIVVVTHFMSSYETVDPKWKQNPGTDTLNWYFTAQCDDIMDMEGITLWCQGHSHDPLDMIWPTNGMRVVRNPYGYYRERNNMGKPYTDMVVEI